MKLGTETGSVINNIMSRQVIGQPEPEVGMGATILMWTDRRAATITKVYPGKLTLIEVTHDYATVTSGSSFDGSAVYDYKPNPSGQKDHFRREANGQWNPVRYNEATGRWNKTSGHGLKIGVREEYRDPSF